MLVVCLGDAETWARERTSELGGALVEGAVVARANEIATVVVAPSDDHDDAGQAARTMVDGVLRALTLVPGAHELRELCVVEHHPERHRKMAAALAQDQRPKLRLLVQDAAEAGWIPTSTSATPAARGAAAQERERVTREVATTPPAVRLGVLRAGSELRISRIGEDALDLGRTIPFPDKVATRLPGNLAALLLAEGDGADRAEALRSVGSQLANAFLGEAGLELEEVLTSSRGAAVLLRLDAWTLELPWELLHTSGGHLALRTGVARQLELPEPARQAAWVEPHARLRALVVGDPTEDLPAARREGEAVAALLEEQADAEVEALLGRTSYERLSRALDERSWDVLHFAGHARFVAGQGDSSGLQLDDELLTPEDLGSRRFLPRLVVANACHAAAGAAPLERDAIFAGSEETRSLTRSLLTAGARAFLAAAWQVDDRAAETFAAAFYRAVAPVEGGPLPIGQAVRLARVAVVEQHGDEEAAWAAYVLYGNPLRPALETPPN